ncbi:MAG: hypothetical protein JO130_16590 [Solirubrobacterales bacterium]|nr:hypothetical protein [Solirubrobacterales bacterium]
MGLSHEDVREILRIIDETPLEELRIETDGFSLHVRKVGAAEPEPESELEVESESESEAEVESAPSAEAAAPSERAARADRPPPAPPARPAEDPEADDGLVTIPSPMLGTFYRAESPGSLPFVEVGARVGPETTVGIIEVMKMMNSVAAGVSGTVVEVCCQNAALVEYGEALFRVRAGEVQ